MDEDPNMTLSAIFENKNPDGTCGEKMRSLFIKTNNNPTFYKKKKNQDRKKVKKIKPNLPPLHPQKQSPTPQSTLGEMKSNRQMKEY